LTLRLAATNRFSEEKNETTAFGYPRERLF
jgi:hypothetical protein